MHRPARRPLVLLAPVVALLVGAVACGSGDGAGAGATGAGGERPTIVATTSILGDVVQNLVGDEAEVQVLIGAGSDPHETQISARQAADLREADAIVSNGADFEEGLLGALESAEADGVAHHRAIDGVDTLEVGEGGHAHDEDDDDHAHEEGGDDHGHGEDEDGHAPDDDGDDHPHPHDGVDPHFFTDPARMAAAAEGIAAFLEAEVPALDSDAFRDGAASYVAELEELDAEVEEILSSLSDDERVLVTNHDVFGYFADRYRFEVAGAVIPGGGTGAQAGARDLSELAARVEAEDVPAIFADVSSPQALAEALAAEVGDIEVVALFTESLGEEGSGGETYEDMVRTNAERIDAALGG